MGEDFCDSAGVVLARVEEVADAESAETAAVVRLIVGHGHYELRDAGCEPLGNRPDAAVVDDCGGPGNQVAEGNVVPHDRGRGKIGWDLLREARCQDGSSTELCAGGQGGFEELPPEGHGCPGREENRRRAGLEKSHQVGVQLAFAVAVVMRESDADIGLGPIGLGWREPLRKQAEQAVGRVPPFASKIAGWFDVLFPTDCADGWSGSGVENGPRESKKNSSSGEREPVDEGQAPAGEGRALVAENGAGLEVNGEEPIPELFPTESGAVPGERRKYGHVARTVTNLLPDGFVDHSGPLGGVVHDEGCASSGIPDPGVADHLIVVGLRAEGGVTEAGGGDGGGVSRRGDHADFGASDLEVFSEPEEGIQVTDAAEWGQDGPLHPAGGWGESRG